MLKLKLKKIAITGGVASGKTTVCQFFKELGAFVVNADAIVHQLLNPNTDLGQQIIKQFGSEILEKGAISREKLGKKAFSDPKSLQKLEALLHPAVLRTIEELYTRACAAHTYSAFVAEVPLLFEIGADKFYDATVVVLADEKIAEHRFTQEGFQNAEYDRRMMRQLDPKQKAIQADFTIENNGSLEELRIQTQKVNTQIHNQ